jgi:hypothetical protein
MSEDTNVPAVTGQMLPNAVGQKVPDDIKEEAGEVFVSLRLMAGLSEAVMANNAPQGVWAVVNGEECIANLGKEVVIIPVAYTRKALDVSDKENVKVSYDANSDVYKDIANRVPDDTQHIFTGVEYLFYIDGYGFAPYYCASKSAKIAAQNALGSSINHVIILGVKLVKKQHTYFVPRVIKDGTPVINLPTEESVEKAITAWKISLASSEARANASGASEGSEER